MRGEGDNQQDTHRNLPGLPAPRHYGQTNYRAMPQRHMAKGAPSTLYLFTGTPADGSDKKLHLWRQIKIQRFVP